MELNSPVTNKRFFRTAKELMFVPLLTFKPVQFVPVQHARFVMPPGKTKSPETNTLLPIVATCGSNLVSCEAKDSRGLPVGTNQLVPFHCAKLAASFVPAEASCPTT